MDFFKELDRITAAYRAAHDLEPLKYASVKETDEYWEQRESAHRLRIVRANEMADDPRHE